MPVLRDNGNYKKINNRLQQDWRFKNIEQNKNIYNVYIKPK